MKKVVRILAIFLAVLALVTGICFTVQEARLAVCRAQMEDATVIRIVYPTFGVDILEYELDLDRQVLRVFSSPNYKDRDPEAENGGWTRIEPLTEEQITAIRRAAAPMLQWKHNYEDPFITCGAYWYATVTFQNGSAHETGGHNAWPLNYKRVKTALDKAGAAVLLPKQEP